MKTFKEAFTENVEITEAMKLPDIINAFDKVHRQIGELSKQLDKDLYDSFKVSNGLHPILNGIEDFTESLRLGKFNT